MNLSYAKSLMLLGLFIPLLSYAQAGDTKGNGGGAIVCADKDGSILSAKLLDLREGEKAGLSIVRSDEPREQQLERAFQKFAAIHPDQVTVMRNVLDTVTVIPLKNGERLPPPTDTNLRMLDEPRNCSLEGVANFDDVEGTLSIDPEIYEKMSPTDQAALYFHEALYRAQRIGPFRVDNSVAARKTTAVTFSSEPYRAVPADFGLEKATSVCASGDGRYELYVVPLSDSKIRVQFTRLNGQALPEQTYHDFKAGDRIYPKLKQGLLGVVREIQKSDHLPAAATKGWFKRWTEGTDFWGNSSQMTFAAHSNYGPRFGARLTAEDRTETASSWVFKSLKLHQNATVKIAIVSGEAELECRALQPTF